MIGVGIGVGLGTPSELSRIIALLRSVGGSLYLPGPTNRVAADGSGVSALDGDVVGYVPDIVGSGDALTQATTANKPLLKRVPLIGYADRYALNFDGVNDVLSRSAVSQWADDLIVMAVSSATSFAAPCDILRSVTATTGIIRCFFSSIGVQISRTNSTGVAVSSFYSTPTVPGVARVFEFDSISMKQRAGADGAFAAWSAAADGTAPTFTTSYFGGAAGSSSAMNQGPCIILPGAAATNCTAAQRTILRNWLNKYRDWMNA